MVSSFTQLFEGRPKYEPHVYNWRRLFFGADLDNSIALPHKNGSSIERVNYRDWCEPELNSKVLETSSLEDFNQRLEDPEFFQDVCDLASEIIRVDLKRTFYDKATLKTFWERVLKRDDFPDDRIDEPETAKQRKEREAEEKRRARETKKDEEWERITRENPGWEERWGYNDPLWDPGVTVEGRPVGIKYVKELMAKDNVLGKKGAFHSEATRQALRDMCQVSFPQKGDTSKVDTLVALATAAANAYYASSDSGVGVEAWMINKGGSNEVNDSFLERIRQERDRFVWWLFDLDPELWPDDPTGVFVRPDGGKRKDGSEVNPVERLSPAMFPGEFLLRQVFTDFDPEKPWSLFSSMVYHRIARGYAFKHFRKFDFLTHGNDALDMTTVTRGAEDQDDQEAFDAAVHHHGADTATAGSAMHNALVDALRQILSRDDVPQGVRRELRLMVSDAMTDPALLQKASTATREFLKKAMSQNESLRPLIPLTSSVRDFVGLFESRGSDWLVDFNQITNTQRSDRDLQLFYMFTILATGKGSEHAQDGIHLLGKLAMGSPERPFAPMRDFENGASLGYMERMPGMGLDPSMLPFDAVREILKRPDAAMCFKQAKCVPQSQFIAAMTDTLNLIDSGQMDIRTVERDFLISNVRSIGAKASSFFLRHSRGEDFAVLDTHIQQHMFAVARRVLNSPSRPAPEIAWAKNTIKALAKLTKTGRVATAGGGPAFKKVGTGSAPRDVERYMDLEKLWQEFLDRNYASDTSTDPDLLIWRTRRNHKKGVPGPKRPLP